LEFSGNYLLITNTNDFDNSDLVLNQGYVTISQVNNFDYSDIEFSGIALDITGSNHINNSYLDLSNSDITIDDRNSFNNSSIHISHPVSQSVMAEIINNTFLNDSSTNGNAAITLEEYSNFLIEGNDIQYNSKRGIDLYYANAEEVEENAIRNNLIRLNRWDTNQYSELGIHSYFSNAFIENNRIDSNDYGIAGFHNSILTIIGDSLAETQDSTQQIHNNHYSQCIFSLSSFPDKFRWNAIGDSTESDIPYTSS
jgi:parallel beta-helix repeat protein